MRMYTDMCLQQRMQEKLSCVSGAKVIQSCGTARRYLHMKSMHRVTDLDNDGLTSLKELQLGTNSYIADSYFDGICDSKDTEPVKTNVNTCEYSHW